MLGHEATDTKLFAEWGIDFVKLDFGCQDDVSLHDGTGIAALERVRDGLNATGRSVICSLQLLQPSQLCSHPNTALLLSPLGTGTNE